jgi:hypothetical protein
VAIDQPVRFSLTVVDELHTEANLALYMLVDASVVAVTDLFAIADLVNSAVDGVIDGAIIRSSVSLPHMTVGVKPTPLAGSRVEETGLFNLLVPVTRKSWAVAVPSISQSVLAGGRIDLGNGFVTELITQITYHDATRENVSVNLQQVTSLVDALLAFRRRRRQLGRSSLEWV